MEVRKLQKVGGSSLIVTLPKKWTREQLLEEKDIVKFLTRGQSLIVQPIQSTRTILKSEIILHNLSSKSLLLREMIAHYISGVDEISIKSNKFSLKERNEIRSLCVHLIGFEILDESSGEIIIKNIFDQTKFPLSQNIEKMFFITKSMLEDAYKSLRDKELSLSQDVVNRDIEVDKLQIAITRQLYVAMRKDLFSESAGADQTDLIFYQNIATQLERIADHAVKIARTASPSDISDTPILISQTVINRIAELLDESRIMVEKLDKNRADTILESSNSIETQIYNKKTRKHKVSFAWDVLEDSLDRIRGYIMNIAEMTLDHSILKSQLSKKTS